jgi:hypothetical protein
LQNTEICGFYDADVVTNQDTTLWKLDMENAYKLLGMDMASLYHLCGYWNILFSPYLTLYIVLEVYRAQKTFP